MANALDKPKAEIKTILLHCRISVLSNQEPISSGSVETAKNLLTSLHMISRQDRETTLVDSFALQRKSLAALAQVVGDCEVEFHIDAVEHQAGGGCKERSASVHRGDKSNAH